MLKVIPPKRAYSLAKTHQPIAIQGFRHYWDYPVEIMTGEAHLLEAMTKPPVAYYWARTDGKNWYYIGYAFYHVQDWATFPGSLLPGEVHRHDLEGVLCRVPYYLPHNRPKGDIDYIMVFHHEFKTFSMKIADRPIIVIESGGHGITCGEKTLKPGVNLEIESWRLMPFDLIMSNGKRRESLRQEFNNNGVHLPDQWPDKGAFKGWFWSAPDKLFASMLPA
jgi:hypothetical protein